MLRIPTSIEPGQYIGLTETIPSVNPPLRLILVTLALSVAACSFGTGKPRPAKVEKPVFVPDQSGEVIYLQPVPATTRSVITKNYTIGSRRVTTVGEPMIAVRNYSVADRVSAAIALRSFQQFCRSPDTSLTPDPTQLVCRSGRLAALRGAAQDRFEVSGSIPDLRRSFYLVKIPAKNGDLYLVVNENGRVRKDDYLAWADKDTEPTPIGLPLRYLKTPVPLENEAPLFRFETEESIVPESANHVHYELVYGGTTYDFRGMVYHLLYKEFRRDNASRPLYHQDLEFAGNASTVDVLGLRVRVHDVNDNEIVYTVLRD